MACRIMASPRSHGSWDEPSTECHPPSSPWGAQVGDTSHDCAQRGDYLMAAKAGSHRIRSHGRRGPQAGIGACTRGNDVRPGRRCRDRSSFSGQSPPAPRTQVPAMLSIRATQSTPSTRRFPVEKPFWRHGRSARDPVDHAAPVAKYVRLARLESHASHASADSASIAHRYSSPSSAF